MPTFMNICVIIAGFVGIIFNKRLAGSMLKYHPIAKHSKMFVIGRIAYVVTGLWMVVIGLWALSRI